ncbi:MAG: DUF494 family protein [Ignavibacteria bacterium]
MNSKIIELVVFLINQIRSNKELSEIDVALLREEGYTINEINSAIAWVFSKLDTGELLFRDELSLSNSKRFFDCDEKRLLSVESQGYLLMLLESGIITELELDIIIERIRFSGMENLTLDNTKIFVLPIIFNRINSDILEYLALDNNKTIH